MKTDPIESARHFSRSLDVEDYASAGKCLAASCKYEMRGQIHQGPAAILALYRKSGEWAARTLDRVRYTSTVRYAGTNEVVVEFVDDFEHAGLSLRHRCEQRLRFDESGVIVLITHVDLPGEQEALDQFFESVGLSKALADRQNG
jgi:hypothetical protein